MKNFRDLYVQSGASPEDVHLLELVRKRRCEAKKVRQVLSSPLLLLALYLPLIIIGLQMYDDMAEKIVLVVLAMLGIMYYSFVYADRRYRRDMRMYEELEKVLCQDISQEIVNQKKKK